MRGDKCKQFSSNSRVADRVERARSGPLHIPYEVLLGSGYKVAALRFSCGYKAGFWASGPRFCPGTNRRPGGVIWAVRVCTGPPDGQCRRSQSRPTSLAVVPPTLTPPAVGLIDNDGDAKVAVAPNDMFYHELASLIPTLGLNFAIYANHFEL